MDHVDYVICQSAEMVLSTKPMNNVIMDLETDKYVYQVMDQLVVIVQVVVG
jgi:hypothetical protein